MPPGPAYNWLCAAHGLADILGNAARIRAAQLDKRAVQALPRKSKSTPKRRAVDVQDESIIKPSTVGSTLLTSAGAAMNHADSCLTGCVSGTAQSQSQIWETKRHDNLREELTVEHLSSTPISKTTAVEVRTHQIPARDSPAPTADILQPSLITQEPSPVVSGPIVVKSIPVTPSEPVSARKLQSSKVPSSRIGRLFHYGGTSLIVSLVTVTF